MKRSTIELCVLLGLLSLSVPMDLHAGKWHPLGKNPARIFRLRSSNIGGFNIARPVHTPAFKVDAPTSSVYVPTTTLPAPNTPLPTPNATLPTPSATLPSSEISQVVEHRAVEAQVSSGLMSFHSGGDEFSTRSTTPERPPIWQITSGHGTVTSSGSKMSALRLRIALSEEHALPPNANEWDRDALQEFYDTYMALKSGVGSASRFEGSEQDRRVWARSQKDFLEENYVYDKYTKPFHEKVHKLRVLVVNDKREPLSPLLEAAAKDPQVDVTWSMTPKGVIQKLSSGTYDVVLCDYVMNGGSADMLGMKVYNENIPVPVVLYSMAGATPDYLISHNILGRIDMALTDQDAKRVFNYLSNLKAWYRQVTTPPAPGVSELGYYHLLGNDNPPTLPTWAEVATQASEHRRPSYPAKRSRESLEMELNTLDFQPHILEGMSRDELEELLSSYKSFVSAKEVPSRYIETEGVDWAEQLNLLKRWAKAQPDFFEDNYFAFDDVYEGNISWEHYTESFNPAAKSMRILVVRDDTFGVAPLSNELHRLYPQATLEHVLNVDQAQAMLDTKKYDVVLTDYVLPGDDNGYEVGMYAWNNHLHVPVVFYSGAPANAYILLKYNIVGAIPVVDSQAKAEKALNYLSHIVATGKAFPNK